MSNVDGPKISLISDRETMEHIAGQLESAGLPVIARRTLDDPGRLAFDLTTVETLVTIATSLFFTGPVIPAIWRWLHADDDRVLIIQGTDGRQIKIIGGPELTEEDVRALVHIAMGHKELT